MNAPFDVSGIQIETDRLLLREWKQTDLDDFYEYASVPGVGENAGWPHHKSKEESQAILNRFLSGRKTFALVFKENGKVIGSLGVELYPDKGELAELDEYRGRELGFVLSKDYWGKGLMPEAVKALIRYLFDVWDLDFLVCSHFDFNQRSKRVQEKCGFRPYRRFKMTTRLGTEEIDVCNILLNPKKNIWVDFSQRDSIICKE